MSRRARSGDRTPSDRRQVGLTMPRRAKDRMLEAARALDWSAGDWVLAAAAEQAHRIPVMTDRLAKRPSVPDATFTALYLTAEERTELDEIAARRGLNRSAFVTACAQLAMGAELEEVLEGLERGVEVSFPTGGG